MKEDLNTMHKSMSPDVVKSLVVCIKRMETDLTFYENNWHLFKSPNFDYVTNFADSKDEIKDKEATQKSIELS